MTTTMHPYEAMFLVTQQVATDFNGLIAHIRELFARAHAEVLALQKWDERRLAFEIDKQRRAIYILAYFQCDPESIAGLERDCNISERLLRVLITRADHMSEDQMRASDRSRDLELEARMRAERAAERQETSGARVAFGDDDERAPGTPGDDAGNAGED